MEFDCAFFVKAHPIARVSILLLGPISDRKHSKFVPMRKLLSIAVLLFFVPLSLTVGTVEAKKPNVLLIVSDDQAWTDYGFMGHPHLRTPHLDKLAAESLTFPRGYVPSSLCCPSLATILTGRYPHQHKITSNDPPMVPGMKGAEFHKSASFLQGRERMNEHMRAVPTLARSLVSNGYAALQTGKWWQGDYTQGGFTHGMTKGGRHGDEGLTIGRKSMEPIESFMDQCQKEDKPFLVWYAPLMPHDPHTPPDRLLARYKPLTDSIHVARYWAMVEWFDETIGQLMSSLEKRGIADDTIVVYVADNGWIQDPNAPRYAPRSKQSPNDGGLRTPIMIRWPNKVKPEMSDALAQSIDIVPTLSKALGIPIADDLPGIDLLDASTRNSRTALKGACFTHNAVDIDRPEKNVRWRWLVDREWKIILPDATNEPGQSPELYRIVDDPKEATNLASKEVEKLKELSKQVDEWWKPH